MNIFVTGGTGFVGRNFIKKAVKNNFIFATTRKVKNLKYKNLKWLYGNFEKNWKNELKKTDVLVHLAAAGVKQDFAFIYRLPLILPNKQRYRILNQLQDYF